MTFTVVVQLGGILAGRLFIWRCSEFVIIDGVCEYIMERIFFINVKFGCKFLKCA